MTPEDLKERLEGLARDGGGFEQEADTIAHALLAILPVLSAAQYHGHRHRITQTDYDQCVVCAREHAMRLLCDL